MPNGYTEINNRDAVSSKVVLNIKYARRGLSQEIQQYFENNTMRPIISKGYKIPFTAGNLLD